MTWQVPGAKVELAEIRSPDIAPPIHAVRLELDNGGSAVLLDPDTATALAAALIDAGNRCDQRAAHEQAGLQRAVDSVLHRVTQDNPRR